MGDGVGVKNDTHEDVLNEEVLEVLRQQPERNPDGTLWKMKLGSRFLTKREILENWDDARAQPL